VKILIVTEWYLKLVVEGQAAALATLGHDVRLLCRSHALEFDGNRDERRAILDKLEAAGVGVIELPGRRYDPASLPAVLRARREIAAWGPEVVSAHQNTDPRLLFAARGAPIVYTLHDPEPHPGDKPRSARERLAEHLWIRAADVIVLHGPALRRQLTGLAASKPIRFVPHGIDVRPVPLDPPTEPTVLMFGRLEAYKGVGDLVEAMRLVWQTRPDVRLVIAGQGQAVSEVPADPRIELIPRYVREDELPALLARSSVVALPYRQASQSGVGLLSIAHGVPVVVTDVGAIPELAPDRRFVVPPADPDALASALNMALDSTVDVRERFLAHALGEFGWPRVAESYLDVYRWAVTRRSGAAA